MASLAKQLMDEFSAVARSAKASQDYSRGFVFDNAESLVNNVMHGRPFPETTALVRAALLSNSTNPINDAAEQAAYLEAVELLDLFVAIQATT